MEVAMTEPTGTPRIEVTVAAPPEEVWPALRDPELIRRWHGWHYDGGAEGGGGLDDEIKIIYATGVTEDPDARVLQLGDGDRISLHPAAGGGTVVRVTRAPRGADPEWAAYYDDVTEGWWTFLQQLRFAIERHQLADRRTLMLAGPAAGDGSLAGALGLSGVAGQPPGTGYRVTVATGEELSGSVWARAERQLVLTVDGLGDGLLVLAEQPRTEHRPDGGRMLLLTGYGLDDAGFAELEARWSGWWAGRDRG
jgi:hypothetical protein